MAVEVILPKVGIDMATGVISKWHDLTQLIMIRERINLQAPLDADKKPKWKLSINDYIIKALVLTLQRVPAANVTYTDSGILQHRVWNGS